MKPLIYVTKSLPNEIVLELQDKFQLSVWEEEDFLIFEHAVEQADVDYRNTNYFEA
jgi:lactate dehydrogenase-like 2-hydroxyacid dehydrogenase